MVVQSLFAETTEERLRSAIQRQKRHAFHRYSSTAERLRSAIPCQKLPAFYSALAN